MCINYDLKNRALPWLVVCQIVALKLNVPIFFSHYLPSEFASLENPVILKNALARKKFLLSGLPARKSLNEHPVITLQICCSCFLYVTSGAIEALECCPKLESLDLSRNCLEEIDNFECCKNLWRLNLSDNKVTITVQKIKYKIKNSMFVNANMYWGL